MTAFGVVVGGDGGGVDVFVVEADRSSGRGCGWVAAWTQRKGRAVADHACHIVVCARVAAELVVGLVARVRVF